MRTVDRFSKGPLIYRAMARSGRLGLLFGLLALLQAPCWGSLSRRTAWRALLAVPLVAHAGKRRQLSASEMAKIVREDLVSRQFLATADFTEELGNKLNMGRIDLLGKAT